MYGILLLGLVYGSYYLYSNVTTLTSHYSMEIPTQLIFTKRQLQNLYTKEQTRIIHETIQREYQPIYDMVLYRAKRSNTELHFHLFCFRAEMQYIDTLLTDKHYVLLSKNGNMYNKLPKKYMTFSVLHNLKRSFPDVPLQTISYNDSSYPEYNGQCADYHVLSWKK